MNQTQPDLAARVRQIAANARATDPRKAVMEQAPCLVAWLRDWQTATGEKARFLSATVDGREVWRG